MSNQTIFNEIKNFSIDQNLPEPEKNELLVFQRAMACLEDEYLQVLNKVHPSQIAIHKINEEEAHEKLRIASEEKELKLLTIENLHEDVSKDIEKKFDNSKKSLCERTFNTMLKCDSYIVTELKNLYQDKKKKFDFSSLDIPKCPPDSQIMQKVAQGPPKTFSIYVSDQRDHDFTAIKNEINNMNKGEGMSTSFSEHNDTKTSSNFKNRKFRYTNEIENKEKMDESDVSDNEDED